METLRRVESTVPLSKSQLIVDFMQELKAYELLVTSDDFDTGSRLPPLPPHVKVHSPYIDPSRALKDIREFSWAIGLNAQQHAVYIDLLSIGSITRAFVPTDAVFRGAFHYAAHSIVVIHNHPSGDPTPSPGDIEFTQKIITTGMMLNRPVVDHIVLGDNSYYSFRDDQEGANGYTKLEYRIKLQLEGTEAIGKALAQKEQELLKVDEINSKLLDEIDEANRAFEQERLEKEKMAKRIAELEAKLKGH